MWRLTERMVRSTLVTAWRLATSPTSTSPDLANATTDGVVRAPSALAMTVGSPPSRTATTLFVVPRSMPTARAMVCTSGVLVLGVGDAAACRPSCGRAGESGKQVESDQLKFVHAVQRRRGRRCSRIRRRISRLGALDRAAWLIWCCSLALVTHRPAGRHLLHVGVRRDAGTGPRRRPHLRARHVVDEPRDRQPRLPRVVPRRSGCCRRPARLLLVDGRRRAVSRWSAHWARCADGRSLPRPATSR